MCRSERLFHWISVGFASRERRRIPKTADPSRPGAARALLGGVLLDHELAVLLLVGVAHLGEDPREGVRELLVVHLEGDGLLLVGALGEDERHVAVRESRERG